MIWLGLGANIAGPWGEPCETLARAIDELERTGLAIIARSAFYSTAPMGPRRQPHYVNAVVGVRGPIGPGALLRLAKGLERRAGRRTSGRWGPRPLDIDILDFGGRRVGRQRVTDSAGRLVLPHPGLAERGFVLVPLAEAAPTWRHPRLGCSARDLLRRNGGLRRGVVRLAD
jgi:2-amino-4-hydroxy-6-hydroxymethyldihydropteridine diphosphokinase